MQTVLCAPVGTAHQVYIIIKLSVTVLIWTTMNVQHCAHGRMPKLNFVETRVLVIDLHSVWSTTNVRKWPPCHRRVSSLHWAIMCDTKVQPKSSQMDNNFARF